MSRLLLATLIFSLTSCGGDAGGDGKPDDDGDDTDDVGEDTAGDDTGEDSGDEPDGPATLSGTVRVALTWVDDAGDVIEYDWDEATGGSYVFGAVFVAVYTEDEQTGVQTYHDTYTIPAPALEGDPWELIVDAPEDAGALHLYAAADYWGDGILGSDEPIAVWPEALVLEPGEVRSDMELTIAAPWEPYWWAINHPGGSCDTLTLDGTADVVSDYASGGRCVALLYDTADLGPYYWGFFTPTDHGDGTADGPWSFASCVGYGDMKLLGACDSDLSGLIDPADAWGTVVEGSDDDNPIQVEQDSLAGLVLSIPYEGVRANVTPFVTLSGTVVPAESFGTWPEGSTLYVAALQTPAGADISTTSLSTAYDFATFSGDDLAGASVDYELIVPPSRTVYVWAFADTDGDGVLNEPGEPIGNPSGGRVVVGRTSETELDIALMAYEAPESEE